MPDGVADHRKLRAIYGEKLRKCARPDCMMFLIGFEEEKTLRRHESAHEWNVMCHVVECPRSRFGFRSQAQREDHIASAHPEIDSKDVDVETTHSASCVQSYITCQEKERTEILCEVILSGDIELAAEFLDLDISFQKNLEGKDLLDLAVQSKSIAMAKLVTDKLELKKSFLNGTKSTFKLSEENVVNAFLWAVRLDCRDIITFFLESEFVPDVATRMINSGDSELMELTLTVLRTTNKDPFCINSLVASLIIHGNNQFKFILSHNINIDGPLHLRALPSITTTDVLLHWTSPNYPKLWSIICQLFKNGADVNFHNTNVKNTIFIRALRAGWQDRNQLDAVNDLVSFGANIHQKARQVGAIHARGLK